MSPGSDIGQMFLFLYVSMPQIKNKTHNAKLILLQKYSMTSLFPETSSDLRTSSHVFLLATSNLSSKVQPMVFFFFYSFMSLCILLIIP